MGGEVTMRQDRAAADRILAQHAEWVGPQVQAILASRSDSADWQGGVEPDDVFARDGVLFTFNRLDENAWGIHVLAEPGAAGHRAFRVYHEAEKWFSGKYPAVKELVGMILESNVRAIRFARGCGYKKLFETSLETFGRIVVMGKGI